MRHLLNFNLYLSFLQGRPSIVFLFKPSGRLGQNLIRKLTHQSEPIYLLTIIYFVWDQTSMTDLCTFRSQIEGYTCLLILRKFSTLPAVIWASPFINIQENFQPFCFFTYTNEIFSILPAVIWASPFINIQEKLHPFFFT